MSNSLMWVFPICCVLLAVSQFALAADEPKKAEAAKPEFIVTEVRILKFPATTVLYAETETTLSKIAQTITPIMAGLEKATLEAKVQTQMPVFIYHGATGQPDQPFKLTLAFPVPDGTKPIGEYKVKKLDEFRCVSVLYSGPMAKVGEAYTRLFSSPAGAGHAPTGETREYYLYWENAESPNNVIMVQSGIK